MLKISLALQGGGAHGAFTWGVLDRLLEDTRFTFDGISGTSAGAMNAVVLADGWLAGGRLGAKEALDRFWLSIAANQTHSRLDPFTGLLFESTTAKMTQVLLDLTKYLSPVELNPLDIDPLKDALLQQVDFERVRASCVFKLFIAATEVNTGKVRLFREHELTVDHLLASACLPTVHRAVVIDGVSYWDGGFSGNPALFPLLYRCDAKDVLLVMLQSLRYETTPTSAKEIQERIVEMGFQNTLLRELRGIAELQGVARKGRFGFGRVERRLRALRTHLITSDDYLNSLERASKYDTRKAFLEELKSRGRDTADRWLAQHGKCLGQSSSVDFAEMFMA